MNSKLIQARPATQLQMYPVVLRHELRALARVQKGSNNSEDLATVKSIIETLDQFLECLAISEDFNQFIDSIDGLRETMSHSKYNDDTQRDIKLEHGSLNIPDSMDSLQEISPHGFKILDYDIHTGKPRAEFIIEPKINDDDSKASCGEATSNRFWDEEKEAENTSNSMGSYYPLIITVEGSDNGPVITSIEIEMVSSEDDDNWNDEDYDFDHYSDQIEAEVKEEPIEAVVLKAA